MKEEKKAKKQKKEMNEKEKQGTIMLIGLFFLVAAAFAVSGIANVLYGNVPAGIDRILGAGRFVCAWHLVYRARTKIKSLFTGT